MNSSGPSLETILMFFVIALAGLWMIVKSRMFANFTAESWRVMGMFKNEPPKTLLTFLRVVTIIFGATFISIGVYAGIKGLLLR